MCYVRVFLYINGASPNGRYEVTRDTGQRRQTVEMTRRLSAFDRRRSTRKLDRSVSRPRNPQAEIAITSLLVARRPVSIRSSDAENRVFRHAARPWTLDDRPDDQGIDRLLGRWDGRTEERRNDRRALSLSISVAQIGTGHQVGLYPVVDLQRALRLQSGRLHVAGVLLGVLDQQLTHQLLDVAVDHPLPAVHDRVDKIVATADELVLHVDGVVIPVHDPRRYAV